jgi:hypothetical protein
MRIMYLFLPLDENALRPAPLVQGNVAQVFANVRVIKLLLVRLVRCKYVTAYKYLHLCV